MRARYLKGKDGKRYECSIANAYFIGSANGVSVYEFRNPSAMYAGFAFNGTKASLLYPAGLKEWKEAIQKQGECGGCNNTGDECNECDFES